MPAMISQKLPNLAINASLPLSSQFVLKAHEEGDETSAGRVALCDASCTVELICLVCKHVSHDSGSFNSALDDPRFREGPTFAVLEVYISSFALANKPIKRISAMRGSNETDRNKLKKMKFIDF
jgi:hypothetical protein